MNRRIIYGVVGVLLIAVIGVALGSTGFFKGAFFVDKQLLAFKQGTGGGSSAGASVVTCDVLVVGAGTGGTFAALQSARDGAKTCLVEPTQWVGGMITAAGVSSLDGHSWNYTGLLGEFVRKVKKAYGAKIWQTELCLAPFCFEPSMGHKVLREMVDDESNIDLYLGATLKRVLRTGDVIEGIVAEQNGKSIEFRARVTVEATELGDVLYLGDVPFDLGVDPNSQEDHARKTKDCVQPITMTAIIKDTGKVQEPVPAPDDYDPSRYYCTIPSSNCKKSTTEFRDWDFLKSYGQLPNGKVMINIPTHSYGNDFDVDRSEYEPLAREEIIELARKNSLGIVHYFQTELGKNTYVLSNEFGTTDGLAPIPYVRESRRLRGVSRITEADLTPDSLGEMRFWDDAIAVGDYPLDIHSCERGAEDIFLVYPPFQVPYSALIPQKVDGLIAAEKNISVTHVANGRTRLQPIVASIGQAAGAAAAISALEKKQPRAIDVKKLQESLVHSKLRVNYYKDLTPEHWAFPAVSVMTQQDVIRGFMENGEYFFRPELHVRRAEFASILVRTFGAAKKTLRDMKMVFTDVPESAWFSQYVYQLPADIPATAFPKKQFGGARKITHGETAYWIVQHLGLKKSDPTFVSKITDIPAKHPSRNALIILDSYGILEVVNGKVMPDAPLTRAEIATLVYRIKKTLEME